MYIPSSQRFLHLFNAKERERVKTSFMYFTKMLDIFLALFLASHGLAHHADTHVAVL